MHAFTQFMVQTWRGDVHHDLGPLSFDAAKEIALSHAALGNTVRIFAHGEDYCEVYTPDGNVRRGTFAQTTMVMI